MKIEVDWWSQTVLWFFHPQERGLHRLQSSTVDSLRLLGIESKFAVHIRFTVPLATCLTTCTFLQARACLYQLSNLVLAREFCHLKEELVSLLHAWNYLSKSHPSIYLEDLLPLGFLLNFQSLRIALIWHLVNLMTVLLALAFCAGV